MWSVISAIPSGLGRVRDCSKCLGYEFSRMFPGGLQGSWEDKWPWIVITFILLRL